MVLPGIFSVFIGASKRLWRVEVNASSKDISVGVVWDGVTVGPPPSWCTGCMQWPQGWEGTKATVTLFPWAAGRVPSAWPLAADPQAPVGRGPELRQTLTAVPAAEAEALRSHALQTVTARTPSLPTARGRASPSAGWTDRCGKQPRPFPC